MLIDVLADAAQEGDVFYAPGRAAQTGTLVAHAVGILAAWAEEDARYYAMPHGLTYAHGDCHAARCGFEAFRGGGRWLRVSGNYRAITADGVVRLTYVGRRHGMRPEFRSLLRAAWGHPTEVLAYVTDEPDWAPWETAASRIPEGVRAMWRAHEATTGTSGFPVRWTPDPDHVVNEWQAPVTGTLRVRQVDGDLADYATAVGGIGGCLRIGAPEAFAAVAP